MDGNQHDYMLQYDYLIEAFTHTNIIHQEYKTGPLGRYPHQTPIDPASSQYLRWLFFIAHAIVYNLFFIILRVCFNVDTKTLFPMWLTFDYLYVWYSMFILIVYTLSDIISHL